VMKTLRDFVDFTQGSTWATGGSNE
jgi:hypothetical protein